MPICTADFERGVQGNIISSVDPGSGTAWDGVQGLSLLEYDGTLVPPKYGNLAMKIPGATIGGSTAMLRWSTSLGTVSDWHGRMYFRVDTLSFTGEFRLVRDDTNAQQRVFFINSDGRMRMEFATSLISTNSIVPGKWCRIEWHIIHSLTVGQIEFKLFLNPNSTTPTETQTSAANLNTGTDTSSIWFGQHSGGGASTDAWLDNILIGALNYPGPISVAPEPTPLRIGRSSAW